MSKQLNTVHLESINELWKKYCTFKACFFSNNSNENQDEDCLIYKEIKKKNPAFTKKANDIFNFFPLNPLVEIYNSFFGDVDLKIKERKNKLDLEQKLKQHNTYLKKNFCKADLSSLFTGVNALFDAYYDRLDYGSNSTVRLRDIIYFVREKYKINIPIEGNLEHSSPKKKVKYIKMCAALAAIPNVVRGSTAYHYNVDLSWVLKSTYDYLKIIETMSDVWWKLKVRYEKISQANKQLEKLNLLKENNYEAERAIVDSFDGVSASYQEALDEKKKLEAKIIDLNTQLELVNKKIANKQKYPNELKKMLKAFEGNHRTQMISHQNKLDDLLQTLKEVKNINKSILRLANQEKGFESIEEEIQNFNYIHSKKVKDFELNWKKRCTKFNTTKKTFVEALKKNGWFVLGAVVFTAANIITTLI